MRRNFFRNRKRTRLSGFVRRIGKRVQSRQQLEEEASLLRQEEKMYREALLFDCDYAYTVNVNENKIHALHKAGFLERYCFDPKESYDDTMRRVVASLKPAILLGAEEFHLTSHYIAAYELGNRVVEIEYYITESDEYKRKTIFLSKDEESGVMYACVVAHDVTARRKEELETRNALTQLTEAAVKAGEGNLDVEINTDAPGEVGILAKVLRQTLANLKWHIEQLNRQAVQDALTGVKNKRAWKEATERQDAKIQDGTAEFAVAVCDVNGLKQLNDQYGHEAGDRLIVRASQYICSIFKHSPVYRIGGDEFAVILEGADLHNCDRLSEDFFAGMQKQEEGGPEDPPASIAMGISRCCPGKDPAFLSVFQRADAAMYQNKAAMKKERSAC